MVETVKITTDNVVSVVQLPTWSLEEKENILEADCIEIVKTQRIYDLFQDNYVMIIDESGHDKNLPINALASYLYGADNHGSAIVGNIILGILRGSDINPLANAEEVKRFLMMRFPILCDTCAPMEEN